MKTITEKFIDGKLVERVTVENFEQTEEEARAEERRQIAEDYRFPDYCPFPKKRF